MKSNVAATGISLLRKGKLSPLKKMRRCWQLYIVILLPILYFIIFKYIPMYGVIIAFQDFEPLKGIFNSEFVGFKHFISFINSPLFNRLVGNTLTLNLYCLIAGFPLPILLAISLNEIKNKYFKSTVQFTAYAPYFVSTVILASIILQILSPHTGVVNNVIKLFGGDPVNFMGIPSYFKPIYVISNLWQFTGYNSILYLAALTSIDPELHQAAIVDGATKVQRVRHIDIPGIIPTIVILLILNSGQIMNVGFEKVFVLQNDLNMSASDVIPTYMYRIGLVELQYSYSAAIGLFNSVINLIIILLVNRFSRKVSEISLW